MATATQPTLLEQLQERRSTLVDAWAKFIDERETDRSRFEERQTTDEFTSLDVKDRDKEIDAFRAAETAFKEQSDLREAEIAELDERIRQHQDIAKRRADAAAASHSSVSVTAEPLTYRNDNAKDISYFRDLAAVQVRSLSGNDGIDFRGAQERLERHAEEMNQELPKRAQERERRAQAQIDRAEHEFTSSLVGMQARGLAESPFERRVNPNRTDGQGGYFVPPLWLIDDYIPALRAGRVAANLCRNLDLPAGTDSINIPKVSTGTAVGMQTADLQAVASTDLTDTSVTAPVRTAAGQQDVSIQLIEQSPGQIFDRVVIEDLMADYNRLIDRQVISGSGSSGQVLGILPAANWSALGVTWTSASPSGPGFNMVLGALASKTSYNRFDLKNFNFLLHGRRYFWFATSLDGASGTVGRPLVNTQATGFNVSAVTNDPNPAEGLAGYSPFGPSIYIDPNVPTNDTTGGGTGQDVAIGAKWDDLWLFEGDLRTRVLPEVLSGTLEVRFQAYNYISFLARYGASIAVATGSGFAAPASAIDSSVVF